MSMREESEWAPANRWLPRLKRMRVPIAGALTFLLLWGLGALAVGPALIGFVLVTAVSLLDRDAPAMLAATPRPSGPAAPSAQAWLDAVLAALPDPVIALDRGEVVVALNSQA